MTDFEEIIKLTIKAMFSDDDLLEMLVLKGGNAIPFFYHSYSRASIDLDFSMENDISKDDFPLIKEKIKNVLETTFLENGYVVFDFKFYEKPKIRRPEIKDSWGGYRVEFKLIEEEKHKSFQDDINGLRIRSIAVGSSDKRTFTIEISKHEFCKYKEEKELDGLTIYLYTPEMIVIEKIRAICQQMPDYPFGTKSARARDFFDIYLLVDNFKIDLLEKKNLELFKLIFKAKDVPLELIKEIPKYRDFHVKDFSSVKDTVDSGFDLKDFNFYFDYVVKETEGLIILWEI